MMYNLNVPPSGGGAGNLLSLPPEASSTPRTPEILNSLIAMTNPFDSFHRSSHHRGPRLASSPPGGSDSTSNSSSSPSCVSPPSIQHTRSQLIKEGLKLTIQTKRRNSERRTQSETSAAVHDEEMKRRDEVSRHSLGDDDDDDLHSSADGLTPEDEERRRRRRERNKIAATKCRMKKRERTVNLVQESEILENQNHDLKSQIQELQKQRRHLVDMLSVHRPSCTRQGLEPQIVSNGYPRPPEGSFPRSGLVEIAESNLYRPGYSRPASTSALESSLAFRRLEVSDTSVSYQRPASAACLDSPSFQSMVETAAQGPAATYCHTDEGITYHNFDVDNKDIFRSGIIDGFDRSESAYCQPMEASSMVYLRTDQSVAYRYERPTSLGVANTPASADFESSTQILDSPNVTPNNYQNFDEAGDANFGSGFLPNNIDRGCIA